MPSPYVGRARGSTPSNLMSLAETLKESLSGGSFSDLFSVTLSRTATRNRLPYLGCTVGCTPSRRGSRWRSGKSQTPCWRRTSPAAGISGKVYTFGKVPSSRWTWWAAPWTRWTSSAWPTRIPCTVLSSARKNGLGLWLARVREFLCGIQVDSGEFSRGFRNWRAVGVLFRFWIIHLLFGTRRVELGSHRGTFITPNSEYNK